jgi:hypothetical protein
MRLLIMAIALHLLTVKAELRALLELFCLERDESYDADMLGYAIENFLWGLH